MGYEVDGVGPNGRPKKTWSEAVEKELQNQSNTKQEGGS